MNALIPIVYQNQRVLTTEVLAEVYMCDVKNIHDNFANNITHFQEGLHFHLLKGEKLKQFKKSLPDNIGEALKYAPQLYLWTERDTNRHCKILDTDKAWEQFDNLEETYFQIKENQTAFNELSPQLQMLINIELKQKEHDTRLAKVETTAIETQTKVDGIREIVALRPESWRKDSARLISNMAKKLGGNEHICNLREESYKLLDERMGVSLKARLTNLRRLQAENGVCQSKRDKLNSLDVIANDRKLIEGYIAIIKEMAIKYGV